MCVFDRSSMTGSCSGNYEIIVLDNQLHSRNKSFYFFAATYFMTYHTVTKTSADYIKALRYAWELSDNITYDLNHWHHVTSELDATEEKQEKVMAYRWDHNVNSLTWAGGY